MNALLTSLVYIIKVVSLICSLKLVSLSSESHIPNFKFIIIIIDNII